MYRPAIPDADEVVAQVAAALDGGEQQLGIDLARLVVRRHPHGLPHDSAVRAAVIAHGARMIWRRPPGTAALEVFTCDDGGGTMVAVVTDDTPFLMSTINACLRRRGLAVDHHAHPEFGVERDADGTIARLRPSRGADERHTWIHVELEDRLSPDDADGLTAALDRVLGQVARVTDDFASMLDRVARVADGLDDGSETEAFLRWLLDDHFVFLGTATYDATEAVDDDGSSLRQVDGTGAGLLRADDPASVGTLVEPVADPQRPLTVSLTARHSTVHRDEPMVDIVVRHGDDASGERPRAERILGLFADKAAAQPVTSIPVLRTWVAQVIAAEDVVAHSHDERSLRSVLDALPKDALFIAGPDRIADVFDALVRDERSAVQVVVWRHWLSRAIVVVAAVPRGRFNAVLRRHVDERVAARLAAPQAEPFVSFHSGRALLTYVQHLDRELLDVDLAGQLQRDVTELARTWQERVQQAAEAADRADLCGPWIDRLPATYRESIAPDEAVADCAELAALQRSDAAVRMRVMPTDRHDTAGLAPALRFKLFRRGPAVELSSFVPILESLGLVVVESVPYVLHAPRGATGAEPPADHGVETRGATGAETPADPGDQGDDRFRIHDYGIRSGVDTLFDVATDGHRIAEAATAVWLDAAEADSLNQLVLLAGLRWRDVAVLRAYRQYRRQLGTEYSAQFHNDAVCAFPGIARALVTYFAARFQPGAADTPNEAEARQRVLDALDEVSRLDQDRILRGYLQLIDATVRTNHYRTPQRATVALKVDPSQLDDVPKPVPYREIFVYSPQMEGIHLRGGPVARGGVRWSDRREDFRTEVLGLMKAQMVKNAVIVPTGSKGGFVLKRELGPDDGPAAVRDEVRRQYETYIRALLDITDTLEGGEVRHPARVRCHDGGDAYLVVAADRGTAALSDVANAISAAYGFWLGDAFASGGSQGYDHKAMGITARGAWVAVRHHFRELGIDVQTEPIRVVGIGDMSGDVFGNGLLLSRAVKLVAAFDHRDVFVDPDPDPDRSFGERQRLFDLPGATWQDYDRDLMSQGGGVWSRSRKQIVLTPQIRELVRTDAEAMTPPELIKALLQAPSDLLFAGGIGTFIKASSERHADVGDRANDAVRVDGDEVGARVIGEGGNLAVTQRGRMQYARRGGRINLDAIDNAAGVDTSDREVNLKILLGQAVDAGALDRADRDDVLAAVTDDIADRVLDDVAAQARLLSEESAASVADLDSYEQLMRDLEGAGRLDRTVEALPDGDEIARRQHAGGGLTRPELGLLLGYAKADIAARLADTDLPARRSLDVLLDRYFPAPITDRFSAHAHDHRLRDELIATLLANDLVNHLGITAASRMVHQLGCGMANVAGGYWMARQVAGARVDWQAIEDLDDVIDPQLQRRLKLPVDELVATYTRRYAGRRLPDDLQDIIDRHRAAFVELADMWPSSPPASVAAERRSLLTDAVHAGVPDELAARLITRPDLVYVPDVADVADECDRTVAQAASAFVQVGRELPLEQLRVAIDGARPEGRWQQWEQKILLDELHVVRRLIARQALRATPELDGAAAVARLLDDRTQQVERVWSLLAAMASDDDATRLPQTSVTMSAVRAVVE